MECGMDGIVVSNHGGRQIDGAIPIPTELPPDYKKTGGQTNKNIMQGSDYKDKSEINVRGWFMSEKLDGIRAYWDGKEFWSKNGNLIKKVPEKFKTLPPYPLDGEFWGGYDDISTTNFYLKQAFSSRNYKVDWTKITFCLFDAPQAEGPYDKRHSFLVQNVSQYCNSSISLIPMEKCSGEEHLQNYLQEIINKGGEGIMIHHPELHYRPGRTEKLLKVKKYFESVVIFKNLNPNARNFICTQENGVECEVKCSPGSRYNPPQPGTKIHVTHQGFFNKSMKYKYPVLTKIEESVQAEIKKRTKRSNNNK